jgi:hypothetical protein
MIFDKATAPDRVAFYQIKSKASGVVTMKEIVRAQGAGPKPRSYLGRMNHHMGAFAGIVDGLGFISNLSFEFKLADGTKSKPDHHMIRLTDLHPSEVELIKQTIETDCDHIVADGSEFLVFERTPLPLEQQGTYVKGRLLDHFDVCEGDATHIPINALYKAISENVFAKAGVTREFSTIAEFYDRKTICRDDISTMFARATSGRRFHENWPTVQQELAKHGMPSREIIALQTDCIRYISARSEGEPGAMSFTRATKNAVSANKGATDACSTITELVDLLDQCVTTTYENRRGGLYVAAFEA